MTFGANSLENVFSLGALEKIKDS